MDKNGKELSRYFNLTNQRRKEEEQFAKKNISGDTYHCHRKH